ncbi:MAG: DNA-directed RNA polymerase subunit alpha [Candidatus Andersenbacteria bacterium]
MLQPIYLPENVDITEEESSTATFSIHPYHPGYGPTIGNALRRVLLSSLPGAAITHMKIEGVDHEFTTIDGVKEDIVTLMLNLKRVRLSSTSEQPIEITLSVSGEKKVTAGDFKTPPEVTVANPDLLIATLTSSKAKFEMRCTIEQGRGYVPSEAREREQRDIGTIALDAIFTPVERVSFRVENVRVGQATDYHKLTMTIATDGTITPTQALKQAAAILTDHFAELKGDFETKLTADRPDVEVAPEATLEPQEPENTLSLLQLPSRVHNALERVGITTVEQVVELSEEQIQDIPGLGEKAVQDIMKSRDEYIKSQSTTPTTTNEA